MVPCPGKRASASPKKAPVPLSPDADFRRLQPGGPFPPASLCGKEAEGDWEGLIPTGFVFGACPFTRATREQI